MSKRILENEYNTIDLLLEYMKDSGKRHNTYHHYTNFEAIKKILASKTLLLSRIDTMNDKQELKKISLPNVAWESAFSISFTYGTKENMALWGLYAIPGEYGARISIDQKDLIKMISSNIRLKSFGDNRHIKSINDDFEIDLFEVLYASNYSSSKEYNYKYLIRDKVYFSNKYIGSLDDESSDARKLVGTFKNEAWSYEQEVRLRVKFNNKSSCKKIILDMSDIDFSKITITFSPWVGSDAKSRLRSFINNLGSEYKSIKYSSSDFTDLVTYRDKCDYCIHESFRNKSVHDG